MNSMKQIVTTPFVPQRSVGRRYHRGGGGGGGGIVCEEGGVGCEDCCDRGGARGAGFAGLMGIEGLT
jgi:hypothetical protein